MRSERWWTRRAAGNLSRIEIRLASVGLRDTERSADPRRQSGVGVFHACTPKCELGYLNDFDLPASAPCSSSKLLICRRVLAAKATPDTSPMRPTATRSHQRTQSPPRATCASPDKMNMPPKMLPDMANARSRLSTMRCSVRDFISATYPESYRITRTNSALHLSPNLHVSKAMGYRALFQLYIGAGCTACYEEVTARRAIRTAHR
jgi:hypothetical protein